MSARLNLTVRLLMVRLLAVLPACTGDADCENEIREVLVSPDGAKKLVIFSRDCGATTGFNVQISVLDRSRDLSDAAGNLFISGEGKVKAVWKNERKVVIGFEKGLEIFKPEQSSDGIEAEYREASDL